MIGKLLNEVQCMAVEHKEDKKKVNNYEKEISESFNLKSMKVRWK